MDDAERALRDGDLTGALDRQAEAMEALREGLRNFGEAMAQEQREQQGATPPSGEAFGPAPIPSGRSDPLGREPGDCRAHRVGPQHAAGRRCLSPRAGPAGRNPPPFRRADPPRGRARLSAAGCSTCSDGGRQPFAGVRRGQPLPVGRRQSRRPATAARHPPRRHRPAAPAPGNCSPSGGRHRYRPSTASTATTMHRGQSLLRKLPLRGGGRSSACRHPSSRHLAGRAQGGADLFDIRQQITARCCL